jgi:hypothetical protein
MIRRASLLFLSLLAAPALAQTDINADLSTTAAAMRHDLALARLRQAAVAQVQTPAVGAPAVATRAAALSCRAASGDPYAAVDGTLNLGTLVLTTARAGASPRLDASKGAALLDERCGKTALPLDANDNFEVTPAHTWGQEILQLPKASVAASDAAPFAASLHVCAFDGDWSDFHDLPLTCTLTVK